MFGAGHPVGPGPGRLRRGAGLLAAGPGLLRPAEPRRRRRTCRQRRAGQRGRGEPSQPGADPGLQPAGRRGQAAAPGGVVVAAGHDGRDEAGLAVRAAGLLRRDVLRAARLRGGRVGRGRRPAQPGRATRLRGVPGLPVPAGPEPERAGAQPGRGIRQRDPDWRHPRCPPGGGRGGFGAAGEAARPGPDRRRGHHVRLPGRPARPGPALLYRRARPRRSPPRPGPRTRTRSSPRCPAATTSRNHDDVTSCWS
jgi:hypothetical protein